MYVLQEMRVMPCYLYNELFGECNEEKCTAFQSMAWSLKVHKNTTQNCSTALQAFSFRSLFVYNCFHNCFNNFHLSKNINLSKKFFN